MSTNMTTAQESDKETSATAGVDSRLKVIAWNIWHGGKEDGEELGPDRVVDVIRTSGADIVAMQETYGSGENISGQLGFHFHPRGTNVSILSRYPVIEDISVFEEFKCCGALIELPDESRVAFYSIWLPYNKEIWEKGTRDVSDIASLKHACQASADDLEQIHKAISERLADEKYQDVSVIIAGDFNSMSHLDYSDANLDQFDVAIDWATSHLLMNDGFRDSYRETNPMVDREADRTWTPRFPNQEQDRIDFIYYKSDRLRAVESKVIDEHSDKFPSDHAALMTEFEPRTKTKLQKEFNFVSYNIRHCEGTDRKLDLKRTASVIEQLEPDFVALQEVDLNTSRTDKVNQAVELGKRLGMYASFGPFMDFQGGQYGLATLSKHPIKDTVVLRLPEGNEPRVALAVEVILPDDTNIMVINVHFDWVADDKFRFAQAKVVADFIEELSIPFVLMGDFNDVLGSRTLKLFESAMGIDKPEDDHFTFSSTHPTKEIDFIFAGPPTSWKISSCEVIDELVASDHRPVTARLKIN